MFQVKLAEVEEKHIAPRVWNSENHLNILSLYRTSRLLSHGFPRFAEDFSAQSLDFPRNSSSTSGSLAPRKWCLWILTIQIVYPFWFQFSVQIWGFSLIYSFILVMDFDRFEGQHDFAALTVWVAKIGEENYRDGRTLLDPFRTESQLGEIMAPPRRVERGLRTRGNHCLEV
jgi:hypothetical protein